MGMSLVQVLGNPTMATAIDKIGKVTGIVCGCTFLSTSMFAWAYCTEMNEVVAMCGLWALGSTMLSTAPVSFISDNVSDHERAQAIELFRTVGDVGFLVGAMLTGAMADAFDMNISLHSSAGMLLTATGWFTTRSLIGRQLKYTTAGTCTIRNTRKFRKMSLDLADENMRVRTLKRQF
jgi:MFS family permease